MIKRKKNGSNDDIEEFLTENLNKRKEDIEDSVKLLVSTFLA